ncbi:MAG: YtxH domain-containing protein [Thermodesulfobacteriota bacterium]
MGESDGKVMAGALLVLTGVVLGAGAALLLAPQSGEDTRRDISRSAKKARRMVEGAAEDFAETVSGMVDSIEESSEELLSRGKGLAKESREAVLEAIEEGQKRLARQREKLAGLLE